MSNGEPDFPIGAVFFPWTRFSPHTTAKSCVAVCAVTGIGLDGLDVLGSTPCPCAEMVCPLAEALTMLQLIVVEPTKTMGFPGAHEPNWSLLVTVSDACEETTKFQ